MIDFKRNILEQLLKKRYKIARTDENPKKLKVNNVPSCRNWD